MPFDPGSPFDALELFDPHRRRRTIHNTLDAFPSIVRSGVVDRRATGLLRSIVAECSIDGLEPGSAIGKHFSGVGNFCDCANGYWLGLRRRVERPGNQVAVRECHGRQGGVDRVHGWRRQPTTRNGREMPSVAGLVIDLADLKCSTGTMPF
jgi:hypothetical protein